MPDRCDRRRLVLAPQVVVICVLSGAAGLAHEFSQSDSTLEIDGAIVRARLSVNLLEFEGVDATGDQRVSYDELDNAIERIFSTIKEHYRLGTPEPPVRVTADRFQIVDDHVLQIDIRHIFDGDVRRLEVTSSLDDVFGVKHQHLATAVVSGERRRAVLDASNRTLIVESARVTPGRIVAVLLAAAGLLVLVMYRLRQPRRTI